MDILADGDHPQGGLLSCNRRNSGRSIYREKERICNR